jgi:hypothetical protein
MNLDIDETGHRQAACRLKVPDVPLGGCGAKIASIETEKPLNVRNFCIR